MSSLRPESHVAQQIRRDKLRIQSSFQHLHEFPNNLEQLSLHPGFNLDLVQVRNVRNANMLDEPAFCSSEIPNFSTASNPLSAPRNALEYHQQIGAGEPSNRLMMNQYGSFPHSISAIHSSQKEQYELRNLGSWRNSAPPHQGSDWFVNYASNANSLLSPELNNVSAYNELMNVQCSNANVETAGREIQKQVGVLHNPPPSSSPLYQYALQDVVKSASISVHRQELASLMQQNDHSIWEGNANEVEVQPNYGNQPNHLRFGWTNRAIDNTLMSDSNPQILSLSLSSNAQCKPSVSQLEEGSASDDLHSGYGISKDPQCLKYMKSVVKPAIVSRDCGKSIQDTVGMPSKSISYRTVGPLGPFTGYATILKSSRFLKSAQQVLDEICLPSGPKFAKAFDVSERVTGEVSTSTSSDTLTVNETRDAAKCSSNSGSSSSLLYNVSKENSIDRRVGSSFGLSERPDYQQKKAKLLYMQEEVTRQCKQYHQQMQMVVSSFESVAGLNSATPYVSLALKSVSKHFRCLRNSISDQLKLISEVLGEDSSIPSTSTTSKVDNNMARLRCMDQSFQRNKSGWGSDLLESQHHVWRPQRGLPERAVAILKAWLFEHFLHPYPTDTDKHMLATQTGLSRNQVSNWFINARVRVWKPMVEEIHMLETKETGIKESCGKNKGTCSTEGGTSQPRQENNKPLSRFGMNSIPENQFQGMEMDSSIAGNAEDQSGLNTEQWSQEKRSKLECQMTSNMDGTLMGFVPYRRGGLEVGGLGSVSLTLGLRHGVEGVQHQQHLQEEQLRHHLGGHMIHDFVG